MTRAAAAPDPRASRDALGIELKDFQRATVDYAFRRMYLDDEPTYRFLIADEVGLGKTIVARGIIERAIPHLRSIGDRRIDIVYICSNQAIARQNLNKLGPWTTAATRAVDRITMLPVHPQAIDPEGVNLLAITPGTSLEQGRQSGRFEERAVLFALVRTIWGREATSGAGAARVFYWGIAESREAQGRLRRQAASYAAQIDDQYVEAFRRELAERDTDRIADHRPSIREEFEELRHAYRRPRREWPWELRQRRNAFIGGLRERLATVAITRLQPDLVILDEFQRFKHLLSPEHETWATRLARRLFNARDFGTNERTRTLLLSATPYRMYTFPDERGTDDHHGDFLETCSFLFDHDAHRTAALRDDLGALRVAMLRLPDDGGASARRACASLGGHLRQVMVRTERLASSPDRNGMLRRGAGLVPTLTPSDVRQYVSAARIGDELGRPAVAEYWKSAPYLLNFMEHYALRQALDTARAEGRRLPAFEHSIVSGEGLLPWPDVERYAQVDPGNARLRGFLEDLEQFEPWRLLWLPPALPYYDSDGAFDTPEARRFTKRLLFSAWHIVPKAVASLLSYEAERRALEGAGDRLQYSTINERHTRLLDFRMDGERPAAMTTLAVVYPSVTLARLGDPLRIARDRRRVGSAPTKEAIIQGAREAIESALREHLERAPAEGQPDLRWHWAAPLLLDVQSDEDGVRAWLDGASSIQRHEADGQTGADATSFGRHLEVARAFVDEPEELGRPPADLLDVLAELAVGSPAVCALRALWSAVGTERDEREPIRKAASAIAWALRHVFNGPIETAIVRGWPQAEALPYWRAAVRYCIDGHLQAVLDEYLDSLRDWLGLGDERAPGALAADLAGAANDALGLRTASYRVDLHEADGVEPIQRSMRGRFAVRLGGDTTHEKQIIRTDQVRRAFNSPFWPYVLATTSVGQEGLDFHLYSHAVVHWNLPRNPVDLEQREGRVHRFKNHAVRKNLATAYGQEVLEWGAGAVWPRLFDLGVERRGVDQNDLVPYWVFAPDGAEAAIERYLPVLPLSREEGQLVALERTLVTYRLAFGQPRQEDLVGFLSGHVTDEALRRQMGDLRVDLAPPPPTTTTD